MEGNMLLFHSFYEHEMVNMYLDCVLILVVSFIEVTTSCLCSINYDDDTVAPDCTVNI